MMNKIPNRLECAYCVRHFTHGGECKGKGRNNDVSGCLIFISLIKEDALEIKI